MTLVLDIKEEVPGSRNMTHHVLVSFREVPARGEGVGGGAPVDPAVREPDGRRRPVRPPV